jgi:hypothetical protein
MQRAVRAVDLDGVIPRGGRIEEKLQLSLIAIKRIRDLIIINLELGCTPTGVRNSYGVAVLEIAAGQQYRIADAVAAYYAGRDAIQRGPQIRINRERKGVRVQRAVRAVDLEAVGPGLGRCERNLPRIGEIERNRAG